MTARVYVDTNIFITAFESAGPRFDDAWRVLSAAESGLLVAVTSELTLAELLSKPPTDNPDLVSRYAGIISSRQGFVVRTVDRATLLQAAAVRRGAPAIRLPDAIHLATAELAGCSHFLSGDLRLRDLSLLIVSLGPDTLNEIRGLAP